MTSCVKNKTILKFVLTVAFILAIVVLSQLSINAAVTTETTIQNLTTNPASRNLRDDNINTFSAINTLTISSDNVIDSFYILFWNESANYTITCGDKVFNIDNTYLHSFNTIPEEITDCREVTITFEKQINISDIYAFTEGKLPDWVQVWQQPYDNADILLDSTHADDEQLFFAGVLPYHAAKGYRVQVAYFTDHTNTPGRRHELLNGLWTVGIDHYPVISSFPDAYSTTSAAALNNIKWAGFTEDDVIAFQIELLRRFKPQVVVGHDLKGEYGHGQHILNAETLIKAVELAGNADNYPDSAAQYDVWDTPKLYIHLYNENQITINWDEPLEYFGGKTAFQMTQEGYKMHNSQQYTWFTNWLNGGGAITNASQIKTYSPCEYGLYRTTVGEDIEKNSFFENLISYDEQERIEQERLEQEQKEQEEQKRREEEESKRLEEESIRLESEAEASRIAASQKAELEKQKQQAEAESDNSEAMGIIAVIALIASVVALSVVLIKKFR